MAWNIDDSIDKQSLKVKFINPVWIPKEEAEKMKEFMREMERNIWFPSVTAGPFVKTYNIKKNRRKHGKPRKKSEDVCN